MSGTLSATRRGSEKTTRDAPGARRPTPDAAVAAALAIVALGIAVYGRVGGFYAVPDVVRGLVAVLALIGLCGYAPARVLVPREMLPHFALFAPLIGCAVASLALTALGFVGVPFAGSLVVVLTLGAVSGIAIRRRRGPVRAEEADARRAGGRMLALAWPSYLAALVVAILLVPVFQAGYVSVPGQNPDGMLGVGVAELLQNTHPQGSNVNLPIDSMPLVWRSKYPIYYVLAGTATLSGLEPIKVFAAESAVLGALTAIAFMLLALYGLRTGPRAALLVMAAIGFNSLIAHLAGHPYHNQLWGTLALPVILLFGLRFLQQQRREDAVLCALFVALGLSAYPLMILFPGLAFVAGALVLKRRGNLPRLRLHRPRTRRAIALAIALAAIAVPAGLAVVLGVLEKTTAAAQLLLTGEPLWRGDLVAYKPPGFFVGVPTTLGYLAAGVVLVAAALGLRRAPREWRAALGAAALGGLAFALFFRVRELGEYFHFKVLAFVGPILLVAGAAWLARQAGSGGRYARVAVVAAALFVGLQLIGVAHEVRYTGLQLDSRTLELRDVSERLPDGASVRLDILPDGSQLWAAYMLEEHPINSSVPLMFTTFPHAPLGRKADYILADSRLPMMPWPDSEGQAIFDNGKFRVYRMRRDVPGPDLSSERLVDGLSPAFE